MIQIHDLPYLNIQTTPVVDTDLLLLADKTTSTVYSMPMSNFNNYHNNIINDVLEGNDGYYTENTPTPINPFSSNIHESLSDNIIYPNYELDFEHNISYTLSPSSPGLLNVPFFSNVITFNEEHDYMIYLELFLTIENPANPEAIKHSTIFFNFETYKHGKSNGSKLNIFNRVNDLNNTTLSIHDMGHLYFPVNISTNYKNILHQNINGPYQILPNVFLIQDDETPDYTMFGTVPYITLTTNLFGSIYNFSLNLDINQNIYSYNMKGKIKMIKI